MGLSSLLYAVFIKYCIHHIDVGLLITQEMVTSVPIVSRYRALREYVPLLALVTGFCLLLLVLLYNTDLKGETGTRVFSKNRPLADSFIESRCQFIYLSLCVSVPFRVVYF